jgi:hypothetical protein
MVVDGLTVESFLGPADAARAWTPPETDVRMQDGGIATVL